MRGAAAKNSGLSRLLLKSSAAATPILLVGKSRLTKDVAMLSPVARTFLTASGFEGLAGQFAVLPGADGAVAAVVAGVPEDESEAATAFSIGSLPGLLPAGDYRLDGGLAKPEIAALAWLLGSYDYARYRKPRKNGDRRLAVPAEVDVAAVAAIAEAVGLGRDLINTPANDLGPVELAAAAFGLAKAHGADAGAIVGEELLGENFPMLHAVGRASPRLPRLVDIRWGRAKAPKVTLVGKGICFDTGGLNLKPGDSMTLMKKDMGGAAAALAIGAMVMSARLDVSLRVLLPIAENSVAGNAFRPGDVLASRNGMTVEIGNTDAEGRLVLADAIAYACEDKPDVLMTFATLTGAARVALGPDLPPLYCDDDALAAALVDAGAAVDDPLWRMPFWRPYDKLLKSSIADVNHISGGSFAGSVTAALFLRRFVKDAGRFAHFDIYGWMPEPRPGRPKGGEPQAARAVFDYLRRTYPRGAR